ncbi:MAG: proline racemase family protein [Dongiaceae bacterium]
MAQADETAIETVEMHTGGEPVRIVVAGYPRIEGATILDKRRCARERFDHLRKLLIFEPRGHYDMYGVIPVEPDLSGADMAVLFMHNEGYSTMCGHATIAVGRFAVDRGIVARQMPETIVNIQCPCGLVRARVAADGAVAFESVPAFAFTLDAKVDVPGYGSVTTDIGYGGAFYAILPAERLGLSLEAPVRDLVDAADAMTKAAAKQIPLTHPDDKDLAFLYGTILTDGGEGTGQPSKNICVFADREVDRSPTGSGVTARMALFAARGGVGDDEVRSFSSVTGSVFTARLVSSIKAGRMKAGDVDAVRVEVSGRAHYTGESRFTLEPGDELGKGFLLR